MAQSEAKTPRKRTATMLSFAWLVEQIRRADEVKQQIDSGAYSVDSRVLAQAIVLKDAPRRGPPK